MAKGSTMLKVVGILMIVFGSIGIIVSIVAFGAVALVDGVAGAVEAEVNLGAAYFGCVLALLSAIAELVTGIMGVVNHNKPEKAQLCLICAAVVIGLSILGNFLVPIIAGSSISWFGFLVNLILPGLFIYGAIQNKQG